MVHPQVLAQQQSIEELNAELERERNAILDRPLDKDMNANLEDVESLLGYTGQPAPKYEWGTGVDIDVEVGNITKKVALSIAAPDTEWETKRTAMSGILHILMAVLNQPRGRFNLDWSFLLGKSLMIAADALSTEERARLVTDKEWMLDLEEVMKEARGHCIDDHMRLPEFKKLLGAARPAPAEDLDKDNPQLNQPVKPVSAEEAAAAIEQAREEANRITERDLNPPPPPFYMQWQSRELGRKPWYSLSSNKVVVLTPIPPATIPNFELRKEDCMAYAHDLTDELGYHGKYFNLSDKSRRARATKVAELIQTSVAEILEFATFPGARWETTVSGANALLDICDLLMGRGGFDETMMWRDVHEVLKKEPVYADQYFMRLVESLTPAQRARLARTETEGECEVPGKDGGNVTILEGLERLMTETRRKRVMRHLETVREMLVEAKEQVDGVET